MPDIGSSNIEICSYKHSPSRRGQGEVNKAEEDGRVRGTEKQLILQSTIPMYEKPIPSKLDLLTTLFDLCTGSPKES
jgi:hypothetical protein